MRTIKIKVFGRISLGHRGPACRHIPDPDPGLSRTKTLCKAPLSVVVDREWLECPAIWVGTSRDQENFTRKNIGLIQQDTKEYQNQRGGKSEFSRSQNGGKGGRWRGKSDGSVNRAWRGKEGGKWGEKGWEEGARKHIRKTLILVPLWFRYSLVAFQLIFRFQTMIRQEKGT